MTYTAIANLSLGELVGVDTYLNPVLANLEACYNPTNDHYEADEVADYTTTSTSFVAVDAGTGAGTKFYRQLTLDVAGAVRVWFSGTVKFSGSGGIIWLDVAVDGTRIGTDDGLIAVGNPVNGAWSGPMAFVRLIPNLAAGAHTFQLQWKVSTVTATLYAGAGTSNYNLHPQFGAEKT